MGTLCHKHRDRLSKRFKVEQISCVSFFRDTQINKRYFFQKVHNVDISSRKFSNFNNKKKSSRDDRKQYFSSLHRKFYYTFLVNLFTSHTNITLVYSRSMRKVRKLSLIHSRLLNLIFLTSNFPGLA